MAANLFLASAAAAQPPHPTALVPMDETPLWVNGWATCATASPRPRSSGDCVDSSHAPQTCQRWGYSSWLSGHTAQSVACHAGACWFSHGVGQREQILVRMCWTARGTLMGCTGRRARCRNIGLRSMPPLWCRLLLERPACILGIRAKWSIGFRYSLPESPRPMNNS